MGIGMITSQVLSLYGLLCIRHRRPVTQVGSGVIGLLYQAQEPAKFDSVETSCHGAKGVSGENYERVAKGRSGENCDRVAKRTSGENCGRVAKDRLGETCDRVANGRLGGNCDRVARGRLGETNPQTFSLRDAVSL